MSLLEDYYFLGRPSLEDLNAATPTKEIEYEIYGRIKDLGELDKAPRKELQEQWGLFVDKCDKNHATGNIRVRSINDEQYILTSKVKLAEGSEEEEIPTTEVMFTHFKKFAESGMRKMRFFFPVEGTDYTYEVDAFYNSVGQFVPWVKLDLELPKGQESIEELPDLPFEMEDIRIIPPGKKKPDDLSFVRQLFDTHFNLPNAFLDPHAPQVSAESSSPHKFYERLTKMGVYSVTLALFCEKYPAEGEKIYHRLEQINKLMGPDGDGHPAWEDFDRLRESWYLRDMKSDTELRRTLLSDLANVEALVRKSKVSND